jgi:hypothetical protein
MASEMGQTREFARYWSAKAADPSLHTGTIGGARHCLFTEEQQMLVEAMLWAEIEREPRRLLRDYAAILTARGFPVNEKYVCVMFDLFRVGCAYCACVRWVGRAMERLDYSEKNARYRNILKFTLANALYTCQYLLGVQTINWLRLKFYDEVRCMSLVVSFVTLIRQSRFDDRTLRDRGWSERGVPLNIAHEFESVRSWSVSCLTDLTRPEGFLITSPISGT